MIKGLIELYRDRRRSQQTAEEYQAEIGEINSAYLRLFNTQDGKFVLEHLAKLNLAVPIATQGDDLLDIGVKQGRANLVNEIIQRTEVAKLS